MPSNRESLRISLNSHAILTRHALRSVDSRALDRPIVVQQLESFLEEAEAPLNRLIRWYWGLLEKKVSTAEPAQRRPFVIRSRIDFLKALRLNPLQALPYVRVLRPSELSAHSEHEPSRSGPPGPAYIETPIQECLDIRDILCTFSDEPDWGMDQDLFGLESYGYGAPPFGPSKGPSSQASFHMAFLRENPLLSTLWPGLRRCFMEERIRVSSALAGLAFDFGHDYWGLRFSAWAMHYLQDLTQPYHARCLPLPKTLILRRFIQNPRPAGFLERNKNLLSNRHALFEAVVHYLLNDHLRTGSDGRFFRCLAGNGEGLTGSLTTAMKELGGSAACSARRADRSLMKLMDDPRIQQPEYYFEDDAGYRVEDRVDRAARERPRSFEQFVDTVCRCLIPAGRATRYVLTRTEIAKAGTHSHFSTISPSNPT